MRRGSSLSSSPARAFGRGLRTCQRGATRLARDLVGLDDVGAGGELIGETPQLRWVSAEEQDVDLLVAHARLAALALDDEVDALGGRDALEQVDDVDGRRLPVHEEAGLVLAAGLHLFLVLGILAEQVGRGVV